MMSELSFNRSISRHYILCSVPYVELRYTGTACTVGSISSQPLCGFCHCIIAIYILIKWYKILNLLHVYASHIYMVLICIIFFLVPCGSLHGINSRSIKGLGNFEILLPLYDIYHHSPESNFSLRLFTITYY